MISSLVFATAPFLYVFVSNMWQLAVVRVYRGLATALLIAVSMAFISALFHRIRGEQLGWFSTATLLGRFLAPLAGGTVLGAFAEAPAFSFGAVYIICGIAGSATLLLTLGIPDKPAVSARPRTWTETVSAFKSVVTHRAIIVTAVVEAAILFAYGIFETFLPLYAVQHGISSYEIGIFLSAQIITLALTKPIMGRFSDRHGRKPQIASGAIMGACVIAALSEFSSFVPLLIISMLFGLSLSVVTSATAAWIADLSHKETYGSAMGLLGSVMDIGHTTGPLVAGFVAAQFGFAQAFLTGSGVLAASVLLFLTLIGFSRKIAA